MGKCVVDCRKFLLFYWRLDLTSREQPYAQMLVNLDLDMFKVGECQRHVIVVHIAYYETPVLYVILYDLLIGVHDMRQDIESIVH